MWTRAVFSLTPVKAEALERISSLMMMVVLMLMNMPYEYAWVKACLSTTLLGHQSQRRRNGWGQFHKLILWRGGGGGSNRAGGGGWGGGGGEGGGEGGV